MLEILDLRLDDFFSVRINRCPCNTDIYFNSKYSVDYESKVRFERLGGVSHPVYFYGPPGGTAYRGTNSKSWQLFP
eukprot:SAG11_NODE_85_length_17370_cov_29.272017_5_plen_76_part_00